MKKRRRARGPKEVLSGAVGPTLLLQFRQRYDLSLQDVADAIGCNRSLVCEYEYGRKTPDIDNRRKIAKFTEERDADTGIPHPFVPMASWDLPSKEGDKKSVDDVVPLQRAREAS